MTELKVYKENEVRRICIKADKPMGVGLATSYSETNKINSHIPLVVLHL